VGAGFCGGRLAIIDYVCGNCHKNIHFHLWKATYCPHCGAPVFGALRKKLDGKQGRIGGMQISWRAKVCRTGQSISTCGTKG
jgi:DNA-directed RNA polymerase subunit RPC12/RpoP